MAKKVKIFLLEDDQSFGAVMKAFLEMNDFYVRWIDDGKKAISNFRDEDFDLCILDVMLPNVDGFTVAREIKIINKDIPLIFLTAKTLKEDILQGFKIGADDYITKPFDTEILLCKIKAILNRNSVTAESSCVLNDYSIGKYIFKYDIRTIIDGQNEQKISPREAELLKLLIEHKNSVLPREKALKILWGDDNYFTTRSMDVFITKLRKYLKEDLRVQIINVHSSGYRLIVEE
jgi:DNA-binding response OmpR family regulator